MKAYNPKTPRPARAIAACVALGLALTAVMVVLHPGLRNAFGPAGNSEYGAILGSEPAPGAGLRVLETDARSMDTGTRGATAAAVQPEDPAAHSVSVEAKPIAGGSPTPSGTSDAAVSDTSSDLQASTDLQTFAGVKASNDLKPALPDDKGDPVATVSGWFSEPGKDSGIQPATIGTFTPADDRDLPCEWHYELVDARDADHDGHPEYVHVRGLCIYEKDDSPADGNPEFSLHMARD